MSEAIQVRSFEERRAEVEALKARLAADTDAALDLCDQARREAEARGDEVSAWQVGEEARAIREAGRVSASGLDRFLYHLKQAAKS